MKLVGSGYEVLARCLKAGSVLGGNRRAATRRANSPGAKYPKLYAAAPPGNCNPVSGIVVRSKNVVPIAVNGGKKRTKAERQ